MMPIGSRLRAYRRRTSPDTLRRHTVRSRPAIAVAPSSVPVEAAVVFTGQTHDHDQKRSENVTCCHGILL